ncbi:MAG: MerR family transcriptional regulator [Acidimicrobiales bacterium]
MDYRVEALAAAAGVSVDTVRFYQGRGLLGPPRRAGRVALYDDDHLAALQRVRALQQRGFNLGVIARIMSGELDAADEALVAAVVAPNDESGRPEEFWTLAELATRAGVPQALLEALEREGVLVPRHSRGEARYTEADLVAIGAGLRLLEFGLPLGEVLDLARLHQEGARLVAERAVDLFDRHIRQARRSGDAAAAAADLVDAFDSLLPATVSLVAHHFRRILLAVAEERIEAVGDDVERAAVRTAALRRLEPPLAVER